MLIEGLELLLVGMATVVVFLATLVLATSAMSRIVRRLQPDAAEATPQEIAAISAAIAQHRHSSRL